ncbi:MAG: LicD family protein [Selenomonadaceae bacterium]|nr:LicD family protein [Selenomonadaceae bacterium]MBQ6131759.1 LicD family protein [Selenomonadaceae bacterium]MBQ7493679.1 LicD family protein [Selenomonadaceae bacterium]
MAKKPTNSIEAITQQNKLLKEQNALLREQNELLRKATEGNTAGTGDPNELLKQGEANYEDSKREILVEDIYHDEIRDGFLVTSQRKKLWNVLLGLLKEFDRICSKHNIRWFAIGGTLLGAVRHKGFIPWDDDIDVIMLRPDYEKFKSVVEEELKYHPYFRMWYWYNYRLETDSEAAQHASFDLPVIPKEQMDKHPTWAPFFPLIRLLDERTTYLMPDDRKDVSYAVWIDILCLDPCPPFPNKEAARNFDMAHELLLATVFPEKVRAAIDSKEKFLVPREKMMSFLNLPYKMRAQQFDLFLAKNYTETPYICEFTRNTIKKKAYSYKYKDFENSVRLPFEKIDIPVPVNYEDALTDRYGNWHDYVIDRGHVNEYSADVSYKEYFTKVTLQG